MWSGESRREKRGTAPQHRYTPDELTDHINMQHNNANVFVKIHCEPVIRQSLTSSVYVSIMAAIFGHQVA